MEVLLNLVGGIALLLWGVRMIRTGIVRSYGAELRSMLARAGERTGVAMLMGCLVTCLLQSSMATAFLVTSFSARGAVSGSVAIAAIFGADVGSSIVVQLFSQRITWLAPVFITAGVATFLWTTRSSMRGVARAALGLGLILLALVNISAAASPLLQSGSLPIIVSTLSSEPLLTLLLALVLTLVLHSSVAMILLVATLVAHGVIPLGVGLAMTLGANIGSAMLPFVTNLSAAAVVRRPLLANLLVKSIAALIALPLVSLFASSSMAASLGGAQAIANAHTAFNLAIALVSLPFISLIEHVMQRLVPEHATAEFAARETNLDESAINTPAVALACAARESLKIGEVVKGMFRSTIRVFRNNDADLRVRIEQEDDEVDRLYQATKLYLARVAREELDKEEGDRIVEILSFTTNLEHIGDIIDKNLMELANKKIRTRASFSEAGMAEIEMFHARVLGNLELALNVFLTGDREMARKLLKQKIEIRDLERLSTERHFERIGAGQLKSIDTSSLHLDVLRDLKRINSHLTAVAYPILERAGELAESRLKTSQEAIVGRPADGGNARA